MNNSKFSIEFLFVIFANLRVKIPIKFQTIFNKIMQDK